MKTNPWMVAISAFSFFSLQIIIFQSFSINQLYQEIRLLEKSKSIESDQSQDLMYQLTHMKAELEASGTQKFVAGVVAAISKPEHLTELWHNGYDQGVSTTQYANTISLEKLERAVKTATPASTEN